MENTEKKTTTRNFFLVVFALTAFIFTACSDDDEGSAPTAPGVYVVGYEEGNDQYYGQAKFWKDGVVSTLPSTMDYGIAYDVFVSGRDVYVAGASQSQTAAQPTIWKNGKPTTLGLSNDVLGGSLTRVVVSGNDVYAIGSVYDAKGEYAALWKNGEITIMKENAGKININGLAVSGSDVYVGGSEYVDARSVATIWKNGVASRLGPADGITFTSVNDIYVSGQDVYALGGRSTAGTDLEVVVWKNGIAGVIDTSKEGFDLHDIYVSGSDVYAAGFIYRDFKGRGIVWKNGVATELTDGTVFSSASSIFVVDNDVYVGGFINVDYAENGSASSYRSPKLWKNGVMTDLPATSKFNSEALGVFVVK